MFTNLSKLATTTSSHGCKPKLYGHMLALRNSPPRASRIVSAVTRSQTDGRSGGLICTSVAC